MHSSKPSNLGDNSPMASLFDNIKNALTPITDRLRVQFGVGTAAPSDTPAPIPAPAAGGATPITDSLRNKFQIPDAPIDPIRARADQNAAYIDANTSPFLKNALSSAGDLLKKGGTALDTFASTQAKNVEDFATGKLTIHPSDLVSGLEKTGVGALNLTGTLAQGFNQGILRIGTSIEAALPGGKQALAAGDSDASRSLMTAIAGVPKTDTYQEVFSGANDWALGKGATPQGAKTFAGFAVLGSLFIDEPLGGGLGAAEKTAFKLSKGAIERAAAETTDEGILKIIKAENPKISDKAANFMTPLFKDASTPEEVSKIVKFVRGAENTAITNAEKRQIIEDAKQGAVDQIQPELRTLADEARKISESGGTADDFIASLDKQKYSPTSEYFQSKGLPKDQADYAALKAAEMQDMRSPTFKEISSGKFNTFITGERGIGETTIYRAVPKGEKINISDMVFTDKKMAEEYQASHGFKRGQQQIVEQRINAADLLMLDKRFPGEAVYFPKSLEGFKTDAQLTDFYNRATKAAGEPTVLPQPRTAAPDPTLVKALGVAKNPYDVLNIIKNEFPNLPDRVADRIVQKFVKTKRVANVENLLRAARNLDDRFKGGQIKTGPAVADTFGRKLTMKEQEAAAAKRAAEENLPKSSAEVLDKSVNPTVRKLMRQDQKVAYIKTIKDKFEDPKQAVAAEHEYARIWDDLNQKVVDEYEQLGMQKSFLEDTLGNDNASTLFDMFYKRSRRDPGDPTQALEDLMHNAQAKAKKLGRRGGQPALSRAEQSARKLDTLIEELGYTDFEEAQAAVERYAKMRIEAEKMGAQLRELKPRVREARILQGALDEIAIVPREEVASIDKLATASNVRDEFKDIAGAAGQARDLYRNFEHFFGNKYAEIKKAVLDPFDDAKGRFVDVNKSLGDSLEADVVGKFGFRRGSKESAAIQRYGDTGLDAGERMTRDDLVKEFGKEKADNIVAADAWFRKQYDRLIDELNVVRKKIYPNSPSKLIAKRKDYYRHFQDISETWGDALQEFFETPSGIDPNLVGLSEFTKAKSRFLPFAEQRMGNKSVIDAIGGFVDYIPAFAYAKEIDPQVSVFRYLRRKIAEVAPKAGQEMTLPNGKPFKHAGAEGFLGFLDDFSRDLTGNTNPADRFIQKIVGRKNIRLAKFINQRMKANTVAGNLGSALAQVFNVPAGIADTKLFAVKGMRRTLASTVMPNAPMEASTFLKERYAQSLNEKFPFQFKDKPLKASGDFAKKQAGWLMRKMDEIGTKFIWNSEYEKGLSKTKGNVVEAVRYADGQTRKMVAGRGIGEVPLGQKSLVTQFVAPFTVEVGNAWWIMKDFVKEKDVTALATFFLANYMMNEAAERIRGSRVVFDPVNSLIQGSVALSQEYKAGNTERGVLKFLGRQAGEILANIPFGQTAAAIIPDATVQSWTQSATGAPMTKQEIFGSSMISGRFGTPLIISGLQDAVYRLLPPVGGLQLKKTYQGLLSLVKGKAEDSKGNTTFSVPRSPQNIARALAFGANATSEANKYFADRTDLFNAVDRQSADTFIRTASAEKDWADMKKLVAAGKSSEAGDLLASIAQKDALEAKAVAKIAADEKRGLNGNDRLIGMLGVTNGARAKYIVEQLKKMKSGKERAAYVADLAQKKLVAGDVIKQIALLMSSK